MLRLKDQELEHRHRIKWRASALRTITVAQTLNQPTAEILKINRRLQNLKRIAVLAQPFEMDTRINLAQLGNLGSWS